MSQSIRKTLTLWYVGILSVILCLFGWVLYTSMANSFVTDVDRSLALQAGSVIDSLHAFWKAEQAVTASAPGNWQSAPSSNLQGEIGKGRFTDLVIRWAERTGSLRDGRAVCVLDTAGRLVATSEQFAQFALSASKATIEKAANGRTVFETFPLPDTRVRLITRPMIEAGSTTYLVQVASSLVQADESLKTLRIWLWWLIPLTLVITSSVGWFLATTALRPVGEVIAQAQRISAEHLDERIDVKHTGDELQELAATFNDMLARLEGDFRRIRQFSAAASHELRTPLTVMRGELEVALRKPREAEEYQRVLQTHLETINEMAQTVEELLALARSDAIDGAVEWRPVELGAVAQQVSHTLRKLAMPKGVALDVEAREPVWVRGEQRLLERVVANLLDNAIRHTPAQGRVTIRTGRREHEAALIVQDTGSGIEAEDLPKLFKQFFHRSPMVNRTHSTGFGLGLCRWIAEVHHGRIDVDSVLGRGSTFTVWLPLIPPPF